MAASVPVEVRWKNEGLLFEVVAAHGRADIGSGSDAPGNGPTPMELLAASVGACTAMDVVSILLKMRQPLEELWVEVGGERAEEHPKRFLDMEVVYHVRGAVDEAKLARAIELSETRYCSVEATFHGALPIRSRYVLEPPASPAEV